MDFGEIYFQWYPQFASVVGWFHPLSTHWQHCQRNWQHWHWHHWSRASLTTGDWEWLGVGHLVGIAQNAWTSFRDKDGNGRAMLISILNLFKHSRILNSLCIIDLIHKSQNALVSYPTMLHSEQKCAHIALPSMLPCTTPFTHLKISSRPFPYLETVFPSFGS